MRTMGLRATTLSPGIVLTTTTVAAPLNVLMIVVDDMRPEPGCYGARQFTRGRLRGLAGSILVVLLILCAPPMEGALELARPFQDHTVLQADKPMPVWGTTVPGTEVRVSLGTRRQTTTAAADGTWQVEFAPVEASNDAIELRVSSGKERVTRSDLVFGEVWIASGQSNMRWMLKDCAIGKETISASNDEGLRLCNFQGRLHPGGTKYPRELLLGLNPDNYYQTKGWESASPKSTPTFSGVAYFFGQRLRTNLKVPVGIIHLAVGGTPMEAHMPKSAFQRDDTLRPLLREWWKNPNYPQWCRQRAALNLTEWLRDPPEGQEPPHPFAPGFLWEAGIDPLLPFPVRGVIWYQGESNATVDGARGAPVAKAVNRRKFEALIKSWRRAWRDEELPVYFVQLPGLNRNWPLFREMQLEVSQQVPNTGMAVTIDVGHPTNVHPKSKKPVGERLAGLALANTYEMKVSGGGAQLLEYKEEAGRVRLIFDRDVRPASGREVLGLEVAGRDRKFHPATARVEGKVILVESDRVPQPVACRYAWASFPACNLADSMDLPASPFRTDNWAIGAKAPKADN